MLERAFIVNYIALAVFEGHTSRYRVDERLLIVCLMCGTDGEVNHSLRRGNGISKQESLIIGELFGIECQETLFGGMYILRVDHIIA